MQLTGNTILITGGTSGIGLAFAKEFSRLGNKVIICGRRRQRLDAIQKEHPEIIIKTCDVSIAAQREELAAWAVKNFSELNVLVNNAGVQLATDLTKPVMMDRIMEEVETNLLAPIQLSSLFAQHLASKKRAAIINISSGLAFVPIAFMPVYCATKAAIHSYCLSLRYQLKNTSVAVFEIAPPSVDTELGHERREDKTQSHGGIPVAAFLSEAMEAIKNDEFEAPISHAKNLREKGALLFEDMNNRFA
jgi:uncharacterized oxidoreductase